MRSVRWSSATLQMLWIHRHLDICCLFLSHLSIHGCYMVAFIILQMHTCIFHTWFHFIKFLSIIRIDWLNGNVRLFYSLYSGVSRYPSICNIFCRAVCLLDWSVLARFYRWYTSQRRITWKNLSNIGDEEKKERREMWNRSEKKAKRKTEKDGESQTEREREKEVEDEWMKLKLRADVGSWRWHMKIRWYDVWSNVSIKIKIMALI